MGVRRKLVCQKSSPNNCPACRAKLPYKVQVDMFDTLVQPRHMQSGRLHHNKFPKCWGNADTVHHGLVLPPKAFTKYQPLQEGEAGP